MLSEKQKAFCRQYVVDFNASGAARRAGYAEKSARSQGCELLKRADVQAEIQRLKQGVIERCTMSADDVLAELSAIARTKMSDVATFDGRVWKLKPFDEISEEAHSAISELTYMAGGRSKLKLCDKVKALELLAKHFGLLLDRAEIVGNTPEPSVFDDLPDAAWEVFAGALMGFADQEGKCK